MRRHHAEDEQDEESFFVSMTDIMVGLLFIFLMIIMYFAIQAKIDQKLIDWLKKSCVIFGAGTITEFIGSKFSEISKKLLKYKT